MALKKSQLYSSLWQSCDELRGGMDASQYKDYILTLLFMKYVSDKYAGKPNSIILIPEEGSFADMVALKGNKEIGEQINIIISNLAKENDLKGVIDQADFADDDKLGRGKEKVDRLSKLIGIFEGLDFSTNRADGDDLLGDAYEYLMRHFATESGKSKGQFYTPAEVSQIMAKVIGIERTNTLRSPTIYDPTCGSGSLLIKAADEASVESLSIYGQEMDNATWALARMNMILHGHPTAVLWRDNTLAAPYFKMPDGSLMTFDFAVANPPFSTKSWTSGLNPEHDEYSRFEYGIPPAKNGDYAFLLHLIASLKSNGTGAIILPHGVLFRGNKEAEVRRNLIRQGLIKGIIGLPANLFYGTGIPACIIVVDKNDSSTRQGIFMIDASKGYIKDGNKNRLRSQDIHKVVDVFNKEIELSGYSRMVPTKEIANSANNYNLNFPRYIDSSEPEDLHDLEAHLNGGIPNRDIDDLQAYWKIFPTLRTKLFRDTDRSGYSELNVSSSRIKATILEHEEFTEYTHQVATVVEEWQKNHESMLMGLKEGTNPKEVIHTLSEDLLERFAELPLLNSYDIYQRLMDYWVETMQDDLYLITTEGWLEAAAPRGLVKEKGTKIKETPDLIVSKKKYKMDLLPPHLIVSHFFADQQQGIDELATNHETAGAKVEEFVEEQSGEGGLLEEATNDKGKVTKAGLSKRLKELKSEESLFPEDGDNAEEIETLTTCLQLIESEATAAKAVKMAQTQLDQEVLAHYATLSEDDIKKLAVQHKWFASIQRAVEGEVERLTQRLTRRVKELEERYANPLPRLEHEVEVLSTKVEEHLKKMGLEWV